MFTRLLVANRGKIACRIMKTGRRLGLHSIAVYTGPDRQARHVGEADEAWNIGKKDGYLDIDRLIAVARDSGAEALHPGYGFLSENPALAEACEDSGIVFVGPPEGQPHHGPQGLRQGRHGGSRRPCLRGPCGGNAG